MKLRHLFILLSALLIATAVGLLYMSAQINNWLFYLSELFLLLCIAFVAYFYRKILKTFNAVSNGIELLNEQDFSCRLSPVGQYDTDRIVEVFNQMMQRLKSERLRVREQNHFLDLIINSSPMGVVILDFDNKITSLNLSALRFLGYNTKEEVTGHNFSSLTSPLAERIKSLTPGTTATLRIGDAKIYRCSLLSFIDQGFQHPFILIESLTEEVMMAEKKSYEKVIRMIAHEVNNSVTGVTSILGSVSEAIDDNESSNEMLEAMAVCIERCYGLSHFITRFANVVKIPEPIMQRENINDCIAKCKAFMESICMDRNITLSLNLCDDSAIANIDTSLIEQVLVNIIKNSAESIDNDGEISISTIGHPVPKITIADNGKGISEDVADKLFTPFFSTKPNGEGLGLIFIREVLLKHNCQFSLRTYDDNITRFIIAFEPT